MKIPESLEIKIYAIYIKHKRELENYIRFPARSEAAKRGWETRRKHATN